ncbi:hypothetical protein NE237_031957 [Protea cynaroides]|uniref:Uncharacterized protein n=1 Tax=Protea cynaroides TaxID=273540 RepID=A0A9Q0R333_9MAGN|nr:hypothetical protein NE237_031957 [Protea cynaroides]
MAMAAKAIPTISPVPQPHSQHQPQPQPQPQALIKTHTQPLISSSHHSPTTRCYLPEKDLPSAEDLSIVEKFLPLQLATDRSFVASKTMATMKPTLRETVNSQWRSEMYGTDPSHCRPR